MDTEFKPNADPGSNAVRWTGWVLSVLPALMLTMSGVMKLMKPEMVVKEFTRLGYPERVLVPLGGC